MDAITTNGNGCPDENMNFVNEITAERKLTVQNVLKKQLKSGFRVEEEERVEQLVQSFVQEWDLSKDALPSRLQALYSELGVSEQDDACMDLQQALETHMVA
ncbi:hypothetical protein Ciccas_002419 [Cichlidogyrus casuarinus]|uniref:Uncharacterized protein n=1 Tax=Cichlidogyrus casuarinus TaxID=1844966 RepID=A0ABD2QHY4_9PLAT